MQIVLIKNFTLTIHLSEMNNPKIKIIVLFFFSFGLLTANAQEAIITAGGDASSSDGTVAYSIGQIVYTTYIGSSGSVAQGVQQAFEISVLEELPKIKGISLMISAYPNPTTDFLNLKVERYEDRNLSYQLFDVNGKIIEAKKLKSEQTSISMRNLAPATYFINIIQNNKKVKTFKIIKYD
jgi:hypothetical protein